MATRPVRAQVDPRVARPFCPSLEFKAFNTSSDPPTPIVEINYGLNSAGFGEVRIRKAPHAAAGRAHGVSLARDAASPPANVSSLGGRHGGDLGHWY